MLRAWVLMFLASSGFGVLANNNVLGIRPSLESLISAGAEGRIQEINLDSFIPTYSLTLPLTNGSITAPVSAVHPQGEFVILAPEGYGLMVVIQSLRLRTHVVYSRNRDTTFLKCRDFIKFSAGNQSAQVCGHVMKYSREGHPMSLLGPRTFITREPQMSINLFVDTALEPHDYGWHEAITAEIVITAFQSCPAKPWFVSQWKKLTGELALRSCSPAEDSICIHKGTFCDGVGNCGVRGPLGHLGYDEEVCGHRVAFPLPETTPIPPAAAPTTKIPYIGVNKPYTPPVSGKVVSPIHLILIFSSVVLLIFGGCTWLAKANEKKFHHTMQRFNTMTMRRNNRRNAPSASAPSTNTLDLQTLDVIPPGEEPPPYNDLFPSAPPLTARNSPTP